MINHIKIRKANIKDLEDILRLNFDLFKKEYKEYDKSLNLKWTHNEGKIYFSDMISNKNGFVEVAEVDSKIVGYICGGISERMFYRKKAKYAELENMLIESSLRGKGIGIKLMEDFIDWCKMKKSDYISVTASMQNEQGINFYRKLGFKDYNLTLEMVIEKNKRD
jgi:GNAT superfamily N-acetyltransferase